MARNIRILGAGRDGQGLYINVRFLDRTVADPIQRVPLSREHLLGLIRSYAAALELDEHERNRLQLAEQQKQAS